MIRPIDLTPGVSPARATVTPSPQSATRDAGAFARVLNEEMAGTRPVRFSAHAQQRLESRQVTLTANDQKRLTQAVDQLAEKGSRESLVLMDRMALVVSVPNRTVITVVPQAEAGANVFTNIDSAVVVPKDGASLAR